MRDGRLATYYVYPLGRVEMRLARGGKSAKRPEVYYAARVANPIRLLR
jgi:hypothetical protein